MVTIYALYLDCKSELAFQGVDIYFDPKAYVGCTAGKLSKRLREHRCLLKAGKHTCKPLQEDYTSKGVNLRIEALEVVPKEIRQERELYAMKLFAGMGRLYNEHLISFRPSDEAIRKGVANAHKEPGKRWTAEANEKRRLAQLGKPKGHGAKISATKRAKAMR